MSLVAGETFANAPLREASTSGVFVSAVLGDSVEAHLLLRQESIWIYYSQTWVLGAAFVIFAFNRSRECIIVFDLNRLAPIRLEAVDSAKGLSSQQSILRE